MAPSPSLSPSPSKKLLITDPMPKSASSSSTATAPPPTEKRTRDQPNLSDCHCCRLRINHTNPKDRLQPLDSVWRIVLLCRRCRTSVRSGKTCTYCFKETANSGDLLTCRVCERNIHKDCVRDYGNCTPWCYLGVKEGFRVCVDCWVPELLKNSVRVLGKSENKGGVKDRGEGKDMLDNVVQDGKYEVQKKAKRVSKTKVNVFRSANGEMNAVDTADGASGLLAVTGADCSKAGNSNCSGAVEVLDDAELAIQLHRVMNNSPRNLRGDSLVNSRIRDWKGLSYKRSGLGKNHSEDRKLGTCTNDDKRMNQSMVNDSNIGFRGLGVELRPYTRDRKRKIWQLDNENVVISDSTCNQQAELNNLDSDAASIRCSIKSGAGILEDSICVNMDRTKGYRFGPELVIYKRTRFKKNICQVSSMLGVSQDSSACDSHIVAKSDYCQPADANFSMDCVAKNGTKVILPSESCCTERDRCHLKYVKRITGTKPDSCFQRYASLLNVNLVASPAVSNSEAGCSVSNDELILPNPNGTCNQNSDRYSLKYTKRVKSSQSGSNSENEVRSDTFFNKIGISATGFTMNCSAESRTVSDVSI